MSIDDLLIDDREGGLFRVNRQTFTDPDILEHERQKIFSHCWLYAVSYTHLTLPTTR